jgi:4a-hydroxytetrahydrobiopterin dehydratase
MVRKADGAVVGEIGADLRVGSLAEAAAVAARVVAASGEEAGGSLEADLRRDRVALSLQSPDGASVTAREVAQARQISDAAAIRTFWQAVLAYTDEPGHLVPADGRPPPPAQPHPPRRLGPPRRGPAPHPGRPGRRRHHHLQRRSPAFWVLADLEGNEACITTWQGRDPGQPSNTVAQSFLMLTTVHPWVSASSRERSAPVT